MDFLQNSWILHYLYNLSCVWDAFKVRLKCEKDAADHGGVVRYGWINPFPALPPRRSEDKTSIDTVCPKNSMLRIQKNKNVPQGYQGTNRPWHNCVDATFTDASECILLPAQTSFVPAIKCCLPDFRRSLEPKWIRFEMDTDLWNKCTLASGGLKADLDAPMLEPAKSWGIHSALPPRLVFLTSLSDCLWTDSAL